MLKKEKKKWGYCRTRIAAALREKVWREEIIAIVASLR